MSVLDQVPDDERDRLSEQSQPEFTEPMLATLHDEVFSGDDWVYERKLDGVRALLFRDGDSVRLMSRNRKRLNDTYPEIVETFGEQPGQDFIVDGEIVAFDGDVTSFSRLQGRMQITDPDKARRTGIAVHYYAFDLLHVDGHDVTRLPLRIRKALLKDVLEFDHRIRFAAHRNAEGEAYLDEACGKGWEGLIAKRASSTYRHKRTRDWLKLKCSRGQELVVGGFTDPKGKRSGFGALLLGFYDDGDLVYAGKVGTGFDEQALEDLYERLTSRERETSPFDRGDLARKGVHWVTPELVAEIEFTEWTHDDRLRHPRYLGLRHDKAAKDVVKEEVPT